jgi:hypothetical protein
MTAATCGLRGFLSSPSAALQQSLESRLKRQLDGAGSTLFSLTWKAKATPAGRPYSQLAASARRTSDSECGSWPTAKADEADRGGDPRRFKGDQSLNGRRSNLIDAVMTAAWPTPMAGTPAQKGYNEAGNTDSGRKTVALASWATPAARDFKSESATDEFNEKRWSHPRGKPLSAEATLASWATPRVAAGRTSPSAMDRQDSMSALSLEQQAEAACGIVPREIEKLRPEMQERLGFGAIATGSPAPTEKPGQLNPDHSRWLMGYSAAHLSCAPTEMPSSRRLRRNSSER